MLSAIGSRSTAPIQVWRAWRSKGPRYAWHKILRRGLSRWPQWKRRLLYADPRLYWTLRGGDDYFLEQEGQPARHERALWLADRLAAYEPTSILEVGCGYGKVLRELRARLDIPIVGLDFSRSQLIQAKRYLGPESDVELFLGRGESLPFADGAFDMVVTSAVILHNPPAVSEKLRSEILRVTRRFAAHNEETDWSYNRFGYDTSAWYRARGIELVESRPIPMDPNAQTSQFCVAAIRP